MNKPPAFQFYPKDWLDFKVQRMTLAAQGFYMKMLCFMWNDSKDQCSISTAVEPLSRAIGCTVKEAEAFLSEIQLESSPILIEESGRYISIRLKQEVEKQRKYRHKQHLKGILSGKARLIRGSTVVQPTAQPKPNSSVFSLQSSSSKEKDLKSFSSRTPLLTDEIFIESLKTNPAYNGIDIAIELARMDAWLSTRPGRKKTKRFVVNWLNKIDPGMKQSTSKHTPAQIKNAMRIKEMDEKMGFQA